MDKIQLKTISLPYLDGLEPTLEGTALKIAEELGELCRAIGKFRGLSGEEKTMTSQEAYSEIVKELLDVSQSCFTMMLVLEKMENINIEQYIKEHIKKLIQKGYIKKGV